MTIHLSRSNVFSRLFLLLRMFRIIVAFLIPLLLGAVPSLGQGCPPKDTALVALDSFNAHFLRHQGLYAADTETDGLAAIWTQAIFWDMAMNAYKRSGSPEYAALIKRIYEGGYQRYDGYNWDNTKEWFIYDDMMWWVISMARAYELTGEPQYLGHAILGFERVWRGSPGVDDPGAWDPDAGGMFWGWKNDQRGKTACINFPTAVAGATLFTLTRDSSFLKRGIAAYEWGREVLFDRKTGKVADHKVGRNPTNWTTQLYNQATFIGASVMFYRIMGKESFLQDAIRAADHVKEDMSDDNGLLPFKNGIEQGIYAAIFAQYIIRLIEDGKQPQYLPWLRHNIQTAWAHRDPRRLLTHKNFGRSCPAGSVEVYDASAAVALMLVMPAY